MKTTVCAKWQPETCAAEQAVLRQVVDLVCQQSLPTAIAPRNDLGHEVALPHVGVRPGRDAETDPLTHLDGQLPVERDDRRRHQRIGAWRHDAGTRLDDRTEPGAVHLARGDSATNSMSTPRLRDGGREVQDLAHLAFAFITAGRGMPVKEGRGRLHHDLSPAELVMAQFGEIHDPAGQ